MRNVETPAVDSKIEQALPAIDQALTDFGVEVQQITTSPDIDTLKTLQAFHAAYDELSRALGATVFHTDISEAPAQTPDTPEVPEFQPPAIND